ncbi:MAG TPA: hypothetical protein VFR85_07555 [Anaeromyxobacteraceae bacterium]|nr:hypothetical protein [Anaeromyxobacteraceae bacterium]
MPPRAALCALCLAACTHTVRPSEPGAGAASAAGAAASAAGPAAAGPGSTPPAGPGATPPAGPAGLGPDPAPPAPAADPLPAIRADVSAALREQAEALWRAWTTGTPGDPGLAWHGREKLLETETLARVAAARERARGDERRALSHLWGFLCGERLARAAAGPAEALAAAESEASFEWQGRRLPLSDLPDLLAAEPDAARRAALEKAHAAGAARLASLADAWARALEAEARRAGARDLLSLAAELREEPVEALSALAESTLAATDPAWRALSAELARRELGALPGGLRERDLPRLARLAHQSRSFPAARLRDDGAAAFRGLGIDLAALPGFEIDDAPRPGKHPRPLMLPVEVPGAVRLSIRPAGGAAEARAFLRELGAGVALAHARSPFMEFRRLGPASWSGAWGRLFAGLTSHPDWLAERVGPGNHGLSREVRAAWLGRLREARLAAARLGAELEAARSPGQDGAIRNAWLARALAGPPESAGARALPRDPLLHSAETLRAELLAAQAETFLGRRAGGPFWRSGENGEWLRRAWADGTRPTPAELAQAMGYEALDASAMAALARARIDAASP